jgi:hypothetical protein
MLAVFAATFGCLAASLYQRVLNRALPSAPGLSEVGRCQGLAILRESLGRTPEMAEMGRVELLEDARI